MSGRFVDARRITPVFGSKPSISTSSWLRVCSRSSCPPPTPAPRWRPTASISSTKTIAGAAAFALENRSRTRDAPTPTNISTKSDPLIEKNGTPASPATAFASSVLPVPGGPNSSTPFGILAPRSSKRAGAVRNSLISSSSSTASSSPATSAKVTVGLSLPTGFARRATEPEHAAPTALGLGHEPDDQPEHEDEREQVEEEADPGVLTLAVDLELLHAGAPDLAGQLVGVLLGEAAAVVGAVLQRALDLVVAVEQRDRPHLVVGEALLERSQAQRLPGRARVDQPRDDHDGGDRRRGPRRGSGGGVEESRCVPARTAGRPGYPGPRRRPHGGRDAGGFGARWGATGRGRCTRRCRRGSGSARPRRGRSRRRTPAGSRSRRT